MPEQNRLALICYTIICIVLEAAYALELAKGNRTIGYYMMFSVLTLTPIIICYILFIIKKQSTLIKYFFAFGYSVLYTFVMFTGSTTMMFTYIILLMVILVIFFDFRLSILANGLAVAVNLFDVYYRATGSGLTKEEIVNAEIQIAVIFFTALFSVFSARIMVRLNRNKLNQIASEKTLIEQIFKRNMEVSAEITENINTVSKHMDSLKKSTAQNSSSMEEVKAGADSTAEAVLVQIKKTEDIQHHIETTEAVSQRIAVGVLDTEQSIKVWSDV